jgi:hypothetical protein
MVRGTGAMVASLAVVLFMFPRKAQVLLWAWAGDMQSGYRNTNAPIPMSIQENWVGDDPLLILAGQELLLLLPATERSEDITLQDSRNPQRLHKVGSAKET